MSEDTPADLGANFIKRERLRKLEAKQKLEKIRASLPVYTLKDIREYRLPYYEAMLLELDEGGFIHTLEYIKQLFAHEKQQKIEYELQSGVWIRPFLIDSPAELRYLKEALVSAETAHNSENFSKEVEDILKVAIHFSFNTGEDWWWLGEELHIQSVERATIHKTKDQGKLEAYCRYAYAKFLIENAGEFDAAERELNLSRTISHGRSWNMKVFFPGVKDTLYMNTSRLLYTCAIRQAKFWAKSNQKKAVYLSTKAKKRANEACYHDGETEALLLKGLCELEIGDAKRAISNFNKAYYIQAKKQSAVGMCEARVQLSKAYLVHGSHQLALQNLILLKETAESKKLPFYLAQAYRYLGEYYLNKGEAHKATPLLADALELFYEQKSVDESEQVRNLQAVSAGLELMPGYVRLLSKTERKYPNWFENVMRLVQWKDSREPFVQYLDIGDGESDSKEEELLDTTYVEEEEDRFRSKHLSVGTESTITSDRNRNKSISSSEGRKSIKTVSVKEYGSIVQISENPSETYPDNQDDDDMDQKKSVMKAESIIKEFVDKMNDPKKPLPKKKRRKSAFM